MSTTRETSPDPSDPVRADRFGLLATVDGSQGDPEVLLPALLHVTAELGGLGGLAHMRAPNIAGDLRLGGRWRP
ncbi:hypothetical protein RKE29_00015 [Streptomyces sp. B1866]|uniref:hypothetical protein n=1 Tax=Streptomyces sp. B1866 TaxID=3075431 RepID=UPI002890993C|nr:hypothetical protein [Streptomyces sp. B1866]MDT3395058.1 hypothetical protein [Streptomyces sp. B1866]